MENITDYNDAIKLLSNHDLIAPAYFIVGGIKPDEGAVITRSQHELIDTWKINRESTSADKWYLLETNYDHWIPPPANDDRQTPGMNAMNQITQDNINIYNLMEVLTIKPVCNK